MKLLNLSTIAQLHKLTEILPEEEQRDKIKRQTEKLSNNHQSVSNKYNEIHF